MTEENIEQKVRKAETVSRARQMADSITNNTWVALNSKDSDKINKLTNNYKKIKNVLMDLGVQEEDIFRYDTQFKALPWESSGYQVPKI